MMFMHLTKLVLVILAVPSFAVISPWDLRSSTAKFEGDPVVFKGVCISCLEYTCGAENSCAQLFLGRDVAAVTDLLLAEAHDQLSAGGTGNGNATLRVIPTVRVPLTAEYWLGDANDGAGCDLGGGTNYADYVDAITQAFTSAGIVVILDLHWSLRDLAQTSMALEVNAVRFWSGVAARYAGNALVFYELYNEPFLGYFPVPDPSQAYDPLTCFKDGGCVAQLNDGIGSDSGYVTSGMDDMIAAVRSQAPDSVVAVAGPGGWAYEYELLAQYAEETQLQQALYVLHPYMGPWQDCDPAFDKTPQGLARAVDYLQSRGLPVILTELGQYCCPDPANEGVESGECSDGAEAIGGGSYGGTFQGKATGYTDAVLEVAASRNVSWTLWAWVPGGVSSSAGEQIASCEYPMVNDGGVELIGHSSESLGQGTVTGAAVCNPSVTLVDSAHGANMTALWGKHFFANTTTTTAPV